MANHVSTPSVATHADTADAISRVSTGLLYKNPKAHLRSIHGYFPSVVSLGGNEFLAIHVRAEAFEAVNMRLHLSRSRDGGETWQHEGPLPTGLQDGDAMSEAGRMTRTDDGEVVVVICRFDRRGRTEEGLSNPETLGLCPSQFWLMRSSDDGRSWSAPAPIEPPLIGPCFELCSPITLLRDGRWLLPTSTWRDWEGNLPNGNRMVAFVSEDGGKTWPRYVDVMSHPGGDVIYWESKIVERADGALLAVAWGYDETTGRDLPNQYALSRDGGETWTAPASTGLSGQTLTPLVLDGERLLCVYRRTDRPGLWAQVATVTDDRWHNLAERPLWGHQGVSAAASSRTMTEHFQTLRFGAPSLCHLNDGAVLVAFWCYEECISVIRWFKLEFGVGH